ncbi:MAG: ABC transporter substrate-binding protein [Acidimicrobiia bacterium]
MKLTRRELVRSIGLAGAGTILAPSLLAACVGQTGSRLSGDSVLRVGYLPITDATPLLVAHGEGFYADEGLDVETPSLLRSWAQVAEAFQSRQVDLVHLLMPMTIQMRFGQNVPLKVVAWNHTGGSALTVANNVESVADLAGTTVAVPFWYSIHNIALQMLFADTGLTAIIDGEPSATDGTVKLVVMAPPDMPPALGNGAIAGYIVADPFNAVAEVNDIGKVLRFTGDMWLDHACCVAVMHEDAIAERPEWAQAAVNALVKAQQFAAVNLDETATLLSEAGGRYLPQPEAAINRALTYYDHDEYGATGAIKHLDWSTPRIGFQPFPYPTYTAELAARLQQTTVDGDRSFLDALDPASVHAELVDESLVRSAIDTVGGPEVFGQAEDLTRTEVIDV